MDWSNESYVRLYVRDTTNWRRIGWDGQCVLMQLLRKLDRAGTMELAGLEPWEAVMLHIGGPEDACKRGVAELLRVETMVILGDRLVFPSFIEAQECSKSDKLRAKESRDKRARVESQPVTAPSRNVTCKSQDVTQPSQVVTAGHEPSHAVTPRHSLLCSALPYSALPSLPVLSDARAPDERFPALRTQIRQTFALHFERAEGSLWTQANDPGLDTFAAWALSLPDPFAAAQQAIANFFADPWVKSKHFPIAHLAKYPQKYHSPRELEADVPETVESLRKVGAEAVVRGDHAEVARIGKRIKALEERAESQQVRRAR